MSFLNLSVAESITSDQLPDTIDIVTALHACNTATDDAIHFALQKKAKYIVVVPCCQAEVAAVLRKNKGHSLSKNVLTEMWRHPLHTREFGSQITNVLRCLQLESHGYQVSVTELVGWEHSMKNELIIAQFKDLPRGKPAQRLSDVLETLGLEELRERFFTTDRRSGLPVSRPALRGRDGAALPCCVRRYRRRRGTRRRRARCSPRAADGRSDKARGSCSFRCRRARCHRIDTSGWKLAI